MLNALCGRDALHEAVQTVARGVSGRSTQPVQNNVLLSSQADHLRLVATDLEFISLEASIPATQTDQGAITVPARLFVELCGNLPDSDVELKEAEGPALSLTCARSHYQIRGMAAEDFDVALFAAEDRAKIFHRVPPTDQFQQRAVGIAQDHGSPTAVVFLFERDFDRAGLVGPQRTLHLVE